MTRNIRYCVDRDEDGKVVNLVRIVDDGEGLWAERYTDGQWVEAPALLDYLIDPPLYGDWIDEAEAFKIIEEEGQYL
jgi:hypothetical protein